MDQRDTDQKPCDTGTPEYDKRIIEYVLQRSKCKPPYWNSLPMLNPCTEQKQLQEIASLFKEAFLSVETPCRSLERIFYDSIDDEIPQFLIERHPWMNESVLMNFEFKEATYREVKLVRGMNVQALIGK